AVPTRPVGRGSHRTPGLSPAALAIFKSPMVLAAQSETQPSTSSWLLNRSVGHFFTAAVLLVCVLYAAHGLKRGWVPADEGFLAQSAERVLHVELSHREYSGGDTGADFSECGLLAFWHQPCQSALHFVPDFSRMGPCVSICR